MELIGSHLKGSSPQCNLLKSVTGVILHTSGDVYSPVRQVHRSLLSAGLCMCKFAQFIHECLSGLLMSQEAAAEAGSRWQYSDEEKTLG